MATQQQPTAQVPASEPQPSYTIEKEKKSRWWKVLDPAGELVCLTVYRKGAREVVRRLCP
jgi:hypothetical protein